MEQKELQKIVNPIYTTAKGTVMTLATSGDQNAIALCPHLEIEEIMGKGPKAPESFKKIYVIGQEVRFKIGNNAVLHRKEPVVVDLPSGYSPRGFVMADAGRQYYGLDLPAVIDLMKPAVRKTMSDAQRKQVRYAAADATGYQSVRDALGRNQREICVITEGLLGYLSESELISMCRAVNRLLSEFGGCWITADRGMLGIYSAIYGALINPDTAAFDARIKSKGVGMADVRFYQNSLFTGSGDDAAAFLKAQGFAVKAESVSRYIHGLRTVDTATEKRIADACAAMDIWTLTVAAPAEDIEDADPPFAVDADTRDDVLLIRVQGRLDTLTAPELLKTYLAHSEMTGKTDIDLSGVTYVSSAGERVLRMIGKSYRQAEPLTQPTD
ncbi:MAG: hypothetical protein IJG85_08860 [Eubacteriaceae bacterium]|nr:hypothetical protein [Eubacteriaceae bacterium]